ncbi:MAG TPA: glutaredoxin 3 [Candidatus Omnitrophota bacterium]|nr:glutaredoxin 3 [Candidatus Omnitrophota bacterium]HRK61818.1 glutaredoxin 3 [Candidatus Omnitrophota bacterium]
MKEVKVYSKSHCPYCVKAKQLLKSKNVPFQEIDLTNDSATQDKLVQETGWQTVPMIFIGGKLIGGFDNLNALNQKGELDALLA